MIAANSMNNDLISTIIRYYNGCSAGDLEILRSTLHPDVVHYFLSPNVGSAPVTGREHLSKYWRKVARAIDARWVVDRAITMGEETVIEWTMFWTPTPTAARIAARGAEWFVFKDELIFEIRSYYQQTGDRSSELDNFPYQSRDYSIIGREYSSIHPDAQNY